MARLIQDVQTSVKNINFENITIISTYASQANYNGIIGTSSANISNLNFKNITIDIPTNGYIGIIGMANSGNIENINLENIDIKGKTYVGGFIGRTNNAKIQGVEAKDIIVEASGNYIGGILGHQTYYTETESRLSNIYADNINIVGGTYIGGILGFGKGYNLTVINSNITGSSYIGGIIGNMQNAEGDGNIDNSNLLSQNNRISGSREKIRWNCGIYGLFTKCR